MRSIIPLFFLLLLLGLGATQPALASHAAGGSLTYTYVGYSMVSPAGFQYRVRCDLFTDCTGAPPPSSVVLLCKPQCNSQATITATMQQVGLLAGTQFGAINQAPCTTFTLPGSSFPQANFIAVRFEALVTLPVLTTGSYEWLLSAEVNARPTLANVSPNTTLRLEATLASTILGNNSVQFSNVPMFFVPHLRNNLLHIGAYDVDGDSLSFQLARPLQGCGVEVSYLPSPMRCPAVSTNPTCPIACGFAGGSGALYSYRQPIAVKLDTIGSCPTQSIRPRFSFDSLTGALRLMPNRYLGTAPVNGDNKYVMAVKVNEWRRINGVYYIVGTTRREMLLVVYEGFSAVLPVLSPNVTVLRGPGTGPATSTQVRTTTIPVHVGDSVQVRFNASSTLPNSGLTYTLDQNTIPGVVLRKNNAAGTAALTFTPPPTMLDGPYNVSLTVTDAAAPLRNSITVPVTFRVYSGAVVTASKVAVSRALLAYPNPFSERVQFQLASPSVQLLMVYNQLGQVVARLQSQADGQVQWQPGAELPAGLYLARTQDGRQSVRLLRTQAQ